MRVFKDVTLEWDGGTYVVPSNRIMGAIARVEEHLTLKEISEFAQSPQGAKFARLAQAYGELLRYAGAEVDDDEIYQSMFPDGSGEDNFRGRMFAAIGGLLSLMLPPTSMRAAAEEAAISGKSRPIAAKSSRKRIK